jgi:hypothetical protein
MVRLVRVEEGRGDGDAVQSHCPSSGGVKQAFEFVLFNEAILWLRRELEEGDGLQGEVHLRSELLWRRESDPRAE